MKPEDFAEVVYQAYQHNGAGFGLIAVDTIGPFVNCGDWNDFSSTTAAMAPIRQLARRLPKVAILLLHHQNKAGWSHRLEQRIRPTALTANADQLVRMVRTQNGLHKITVGGRNKPDPFPFDEPVTISISSDEIKFIGTARMKRDELLGDLPEGDEPTTVCKELQEVHGRRRRATDGKPCCGRLSRRR